MNNETFTTTVSINASLELVWSYFTDIKHIGEWANGSPDWETTAIKNDLQPGGEFLSRMAAKDGSQSFDFGGVYDEVIPHSKIAYTMGDGLGGPGGRGGARPPGSAGEVSGREG
jgi:uncharacterized protein YndB with AHSA1/START domain